jgi:transposase-like protein
MGLIIESQQPGIGMARIYKKHGSKFRLKVALEAIKGKKTIAELCQEFSVAASQISAWKKQVEESAQSLFESKQPKDHQEEIDKLHRVIGKITAERDFLERVLKR